MGRKRRNKANSQSLKKREQESTEFRKILALTQKIAIERQEDFNWKKRFFETQEPETEIEVLQNELGGFSANNTDLSSDRDCYLGANKERTRQIGERLNSIGGFNLMQQVAESIPLVDQRELDFAWDGIGEWRC